MKLDKVLTAALDREAIELDTPEAAAWKARADAMFEAWPVELASLPPVTVDQSHIDRTVKVVDSMLKAIAAHPPELPCHGVTHTIRVLSNGLRIARRDRLTALDALRLELAAASHDLGRLLLHRDGVLRHADVSAVMLEELRPDLRLPPAIVSPVRHAIANHSAKRVDFLPVKPRVIDDVRSADKLDALDEIGFVRAVLYQGQNERVSVRPSVGTRAEKNVLWGWWKNILIEEEVIISRSERELIGRARDRSRLIGREMADFSAPPETLEARFREAVALVEPDASRTAIAGTIERLSGLSRRERRIWAGLLTAIVAEIRGLEAQRFDDLDYAARRGRADMAPFARLLLDWSHRVEAAGSDLLHVDDPAA